MFTTQEVLDIVKEAEAETAAKKSRKRPYKPSISVEIKGDEEDELENISSDSESDCIIVADRNVY